MTTEFTKIDPDFLKFKQELTPEHLFELLGTRPEGLSSVEAGQRLASFGPNKLQEAKRGVAEAIIPGQVTWKSLTREDLEMLFDV